MTTGTPATDPTASPANVRIIWTTHLTYELVTDSEALRTALLAALIDGHPDHATWTRRLNAAGPEELAIIAQGFSQWTGADGVLSRGLVTGWLDTREQDAMIITDTTEIESADLADHEHGA